MESLNKLDGIYIMKTFIWGPFFFIYFEATNIFKGKYFIKFKNKDSSCLLKIHLYIVLLVKKQLNKDI